jgi:23S rRNA (uracil1939-C5)-methyltransferase
VKITVDRLGHHGDGIAIGDSGPIYAPGLLPGEEATGDLTGDRLTNIRIDTPSTFRVKPPCPHARSCGGCLIQHASDAFVADWKEGIVRGALAGQGLSADFRPIVTSPARSRRRATFAGRKTKGGALIGFHGRSSDMMIAVPQCQLVQPELLATVPGLEALVRLGGSRSAELHLTVTSSIAGADVAVTGGKPLDAETQLQMARICETHGFARLTWNDETVAMRAQPMQRFGRVLVAPPPGAFLQATAEGEAALVRAVSLAVGTARKIVDLFAGCGTFALALADRAEVHAVESDPAMTRAMEKAARNTEGLRRVTVEARDLFRRPLEQDELKGVEAAVIDPPRAGAEAQIARLAVSAIPVIAMVSCNPVTFARDARALVSAGYRIDWLQVIDQFRWSSHVELVASFSRAD